MAKPVFNRRKSKLIRVVLIVLLILHFLPYTIPLSEPATESPETPFDNSRFLTVEGVKIHYRIWKPETRLQDPVVLIHGLGGSTFSWRNNWKALREAGFPVVALDLPAFGYSSRRRGLTHSQDNRSQWVFGLLDSLVAAEELSLAEGYHLVGHSMGGGVITGMALDRPDQVKSVTYVAGAVLNEPPRLRGVLSYPPLKRTVSVLGEHIFFSRNRLEGILASAYGREVDDEELTGYFEPFKLPGTGRAWGDLLSTSTSFQQSDVDGITTPALLIWGDQDSWVPLEEGQRLAKALPDARFTVLEGSAHTPMETDSQAFNTLLVNFLESR